MKSSDREILFDVLAGSVAVLAFVASIQITKLFHGYYGLTLHDFLLLTYLVLSWLVLALCHWAFRVDLDRSARLWMLQSALVAAVSTYGPLLLKQWGATTVVAILGMVSFLGLWISINASDKMRAGLRRVVAFVPALLFITPVVMGSWVSRPVLWLGEGNEILPEQRTATVVLLFDELNARDNAGMQKVLHDRGLKVAFKPVYPVHNSTIEVVPAVFVGQSFAGANPCGLTTVCTDGAALDFAKVRVQRNDVDVVGFHLPYCSIQGLRSCQRLTTSRSIFDDSLWSCGVSSRLEFLASHDREACQQFASKPWLAMRNEVIMALLSAPALQQGGVVYAHLPVPHPPSKGTGSISEQYRRNLLVVEDVLVQVLNKLEMNQVEPRILIFSDHPFRQALHCANEISHFGGPCRIDPQLVDVQVPLLIAARSDLPSIEKIKSNQQVFDLLRTWVQQ